jgi:hypothetical protein
VRDQLCRPQGQVPGAKGNCAAKAIGSGLLEPGSGL